MWYPPPPRRINLGRGCRQGDPIAGYLFILSIEILLLKIKNHPDILPWKSIKGNTQVCDGYADDLNIYIQLQNPEKQLGILLKIFNDFQRISGLTINIGKTKYVKFGINPHNDIQITQSPFEQVTEDNFKLLGVLLNPELSHLEINWEKALGSARKEAHKWAGIGTFHFGKVNIAKTCLLSKFTHLAAVIPPPVKKVLKK